jgi:hypothetical protein
MTTPENTMNPQIATAAIERYFVKKGIVDNSKKSIASSLNTLIRLELLNEFERPEHFLDNIAKAEKTEGQKYSQSSVDRWCKVMSNIAWNLTDEEKLAVIQKRHRLDAEANSIRKTMKFSNKQLLTQFNDRIHDLYKAYNYGAYNQYKTGNSDQMMTEKQTANFQKHSILLNKVLEALFDLPIKGLEKANVLYLYQFLVAALIYLLADRNRRRDIGDTMIEDDGKKDGVFLTPEGILIRKARKTFEKEVLLPITDTRLMQHVDTLTKIRKSKNQKYLFLKRDGDRSTDGNWFSNSFKNILAKLKIGDNLTMGTFRMAYGIMLSEKHDGSVKSEESIADKMGHSWEVHQRRYNLTALEAGTLVEEIAESGEE